jgi:hypothetical protein
LIQPHAFATYDRVIAEYVNATVALHEQAGALEFAPLD